MINIGVVTRCRRKNFKFNICGREINVITAYLKNKENQKKLDKIKEKLIKKGCDLILKEDILKNEFELKSIEKTEKLLSFDLLKQVYYKCAAELKLKEHKLKMLIKDKNALALDTKSILEICRTVSKLSIKTENAEKTKRMSEEIFEEIGAFLYMKKDDESSNDDVSFDVDEKTLRIKPDVFINEILFEEICDLDITVYEWTEFLKNLGITLSLEEIKGNKVYFKFN